MNGKKRSKGSSLFSLYLDLDDSFGKKFDTRAQRSGTKLLSGVLTSASALLLRLDVFSFLSISNRFSCSLSVLTSSGVALDGSAMASY